MLTPAIRPVWFSFFGGGDGDDVGVPITLTCDVTTALPSDAGRESVCVRSFTVVDALGAASDVGVFSERVRDGRVVDASPAPPAALVVRAALELGVSLEELEVRAALELGELLVELALRSRLVLPFSLVLCGREARDELALSLVRSLVRSLALLLERLPAPCVRRDDDDDAVLSAAGICTGRLVNSPPISDSSVQCT